jgi:hypothetical protein
MIVDLLIERLLLMSSRFTPTPPFRSGVLKRAVKFCAETALDLLFCIETRRGL